MLLSLRIVDRYVLAECFKTWAGVLGVLVVLTLGVGFARFIADAASGELPASTVLTVAGFSAMENMEIVLPVSVLLTILLLVGRLCRDNEMAALKAGGIGLVRLYRPVLVFAGLMAALAAALSLALTPHANAALTELGKQFGLAAQLQSFEAGRFHTFLDGRAAFYALSINDESGAFDNVFIRVRSEAGEEIVVLADSAVQQYDEATGRQTLVLHDGWRYEGTPGQADYRVIRFEEHGVRMRPPTGHADYELAAIDTGQLLGQDTVKARAEVQRRLGIPLSVLLLALVALPLGQTRPRAGRYGKLVLGVMLYLGYANSLRLAEVWYIRGDVPQVLGLWWVHGLVLLLALILIAREQGMGRPRRRLAVGA